MALIVTGWGNDDDRAPPPGELRWRVGDRGNVAVLELVCHDAYEAIEVAEKMGEALAEGCLEISVSNRWLGEDTA